MIKRIVNYTFRIMLSIAVMLPMVLEPLAVKAASSATTIAELKAELAVLKKEKTDAANSKYQTQSEINNKKNAIYSAYKEQEQIAIDIQNAKDQIAANEIKIEELTEETNNLLIYLQMSEGDSSYLQYITKAQSITDLIMRISAIEQITEYNEKTLEELKNLIIKDEELQVELAAKNEELNAKIDSYSSAIASLSTQLSELNEINEDIDDQIKNQESLIKYYQGICKSETQKLTDCVAILNDTGWNKPLEKGKITSNWGYRVDPITGATSSFHNGVDIGGNGEGTPVYSAAAGMVAAITVKSKCGGNIVYIHHVINGVAYTTQYAHLLTINVKVGQSVTAATQIGSVGGGSGTRSYDRCSTGAHLHFATHKGHYLGGGSSGYSSWSKFIANSVKPTFFPAKGVWWYKRA